MHTLSTSILGPSPTYCAAAGPAAVPQRLATVLLAAGVSAMVVATDRFLDTWAQAHAVAAWLALWAVAVLAIVLLRGLTRVLAQKLITGLDAGAAQLARRRAHERLRAMAQKDPRWMRDQALARVPAAVHIPHVRDPESLKTRRAARLLRDGLYYI